MMRLVWFMNYDRLHCLVPFISASVKIIKHIIVYLTGYAHFKGQVLNAEDADCLFQGLKLNSIDGQFSHLLTGKALGEDMISTNQCILTV